MNAQVQKPTPGLLGDELLHRLKNIQDAEQSAAFDVTRKLRSGEVVSDGDLIDALYAFAVRLDIASPLCLYAMRR